MKTVTKNMEKSKLFLHAKIPLFPCFAGGTAPRRASGKQWYFSISAISSKQEQSAWISRIASAFFPLHIK
jgi:hypothetical protein